MRVGKPTLEGHSGSVAQRMDVEDIYVQEEFIAVRRGRAQKKAHLTQESATLRACKLYPPKKGKVSFTRKYATVWADLVSDKLIGTL